MSSTWMQERQSALHSMLGVELMDDALMPPVTQIADGSLFDGYEDYLRYTKTAAEHGRDQVGAARITRQLGRMGVIRAFYQRGYSKKRALDEIPDHLRESKEIDAAFAGALLPAVEGLAAYVRNFHRMTELAARSQADNDRAAIGRAYALEAIKGLVATDEMTIDDAETLASLLGIASRDPDTEDGSADNTDSLPDTTQADDQKRTTLRLALLDKFQALPGSVRNGFEARAHHMFMDFCLPRQGETSMEAACKRFRRGTKKWTDEEATAETQRVIVDIITKTLTSRTQFKQFDAVACEQSVLKVVDHKAGMPPAP